MTAWMVAVNALAVFLGILIVRIHDRKLRLGSAFLLLTILLWINPLLSLYMGNSQETMQFAAKLMFTGSALTLLTFGIFIFLFTNRLREFAHPFFILFGSIQLFMAGAAILSDWIIVEVTYTDTLRIRYGFLQKLFVVSFFLSEIYIFGRLYQSWKKADNELFKVQCGALLLSTLISFNLIVISNGVLPIYLKHSGYSYTGSIWLLFFFAGLLYLLLNGQSIYLRNALRELLALPEVKQSPENILSVRRFIGSLRFLLAEKPTVFERRFSFRDLQLGSVSEVTMAGGKDRPYRLKSLINSSWVRGLVDRVRLLEHENDALMLALLRTSNEKSDDLVEAFQITGRSSLTTTPQKKLGPLEQAECQVIQQHLHRNKFNKNRTRKELDITINTLNAKMHKYGIQIPK